MNLGRSLGHILVVVLFLMQAAAFSSPAQAQIQTVVVRGDPAPLPGSEFRKLNLPFVSDAAGEHIVFRGTSRGLGGGVHGIYRVDDSGAGSLIVQKSEFFFGRKFRNLRRPAINGSGDVAWFGFLTGGVDGVFRTVGAAGPIGVTLTLEPTPVGGVFLALGMPGITDTGAVLFWARTSAIGLEEGIFRCQGGDGDCFSGTGTGVMDYVVVSGMAIPDRPGRKLCTFPEGLRKSAYGIAFRSLTKTNCSNAGETAIQGVFRLDFAGAVGIETLALAGESTDLGGGATYDRFRDAPSIENNGLVTFYASTVGSPKTEAVFLCDPAVCPAAVSESVVERGDLDADGNELVKLFSPQIADNGDIFFQAKPRGPTAGGPTFYALRFAGALERIVTRGDSVPDTPPAIFRRVGSHELTPGGTLVFRSKIKGDGIGGTTGIFVLP